MKSLSTVAKKIANIALKSQSCAICKPLKRLILILAFFFFVQTSFALESSSLPDFSQNYRLSFPLTTKRKYATRYLKETRELIIKIIPARAEEFEVARYYDSQFINRVVVEEINNEVTLTLQLKNYDLAWLVASQDNPWRIIVDVWKVDSQERDKRSESWNWDKVTSGSVTSLDGLASTIQDKKNGANLAPTQKNKQDSKLQQLTPHSLTAVSQKPPSSKDVGQTRNAGKIEKLPEIFRRIEPITQIDEKTLAQLKTAIGSSVGKDNEFESTAKLAALLYNSGREEESLPFFRRLPALNHEKFKSDPRLLLKAGESAFLSGEFALAFDYFSTLYTVYPGDPSSIFASLRLTDINELRKNKSFPVSQDNALQYSKLALNDKTPENVRIAAVLRILEGIVEENPSAAKIYQKSLDSCVNNKLVPFDLLKNCFYDHIISNVDNLELSSADVAVQNFKKHFQSDSRVLALENIIISKTRELLKQTKLNKQWDIWIGFEKKVRPSLLEFTLKEPDALFARAEAFEEAGDNKHSARLYGLFWKISSDPKLRIEAAATAAKLLLKSNSPIEAQGFVSRIDADYKKDDLGLSQKTLSALKEMSAVPFKNPTALKILVSEMKKGRYEERDMKTLIEWSTLLRKSGGEDSQVLYEKLLSYPTKDPQETFLLQEELFRFADSLREAGRFQRAGEIYLSIANLSLGTRKGEAAYKAGIVLSRAGMFDKAKDAFALAASDTVDKRYSALATERLDRIR